MGILFWDRIEQWNLLSNNSEFKYGGVNPCAEEPLPAGGSCLLGSMNLSEYVTKDKYFDYETFNNDIQIAVRCLNDVLDEGLPLHPLKEQRESVKQWRQIGLGIMGLADMLIKMEISYDSDKALELCDSIAQTMINSAMRASATIASSKGVFDNYNGKMLLTNFGSLNLNLDTYQFVEKYGLRNSQLLTIAPTGTLSSMLGVSGGLEPIFANSYTRKTESLHGKDVYYKVYTPIVDRYMKEHNLTEEEQLPKWFVTSSTINPFKRIEMQGIWQKHIDASISSTVNLPESATVDDIFNLYIEAWKQGLKGLTIFRDGCKRLGILTTNTTNKDNSQEDNVPSNNKFELKRGDIISCDDTVIGKKRKIQTGCGSEHILAYFDPETGDLMEVYLTKGSSGGCNNLLTGLSRTISLLCRAGVNVYDIKDQLDSTGACPSYAIRTATKHDTSKGSCCPMAVGNVLVDMWEEMQKELGIDDDTSDKEPSTLVDAKGAEYKLVLETHVEPISNATKDNDNVRRCPECGEPLVATGGCFSCFNCSYTKCE